MVQRLCLPNGTWMMDWDLGEKATFHSCAPPGITDDPNMMRDEQNFKYVSSNFANNSVDHIVVFQYILFYLFFFFIVF